MKSDEISDEIGDEIKSTQIKPALPSSHHDKVYVRWFDHLASIKVSSDKVINHFNPWLPSWSKKDAGKITYEH